jgi:hypothetical protein
MTVTLIAAAVLCGIVGVGGAMELTLDAPSRSAWVRFGVGATGLLLCGGLFSLLK